MNPADEGARIEEANRGTAAAHLLANPMLVETLDIIERSYVDAWSTNMAPDGMTLRLGPEGREALWNALQAVRKVRAHIESVAMTGRMARAQLEALVNNR